MKTVTTPKPSTKPTEPAKADKPAKTAKAPAKSPAATRKTSTRGRQADGSANPVDMHVGARMRLRRTLMGMSQEKLGEAIGLTFQQVQKYERGANRVGASRLFDLSRVLDVPVSFFFDDMGDSVQAASPAAIIKGQPLDIQGAPGQDDPMVKRETLGLVRAYYTIADPKVRRQVYELAKALARSESEV